MMMKKCLSFGAVTILLASMIAACGGNNNKESSSIEKSSNPISYSSSKQSTSKGPVKRVTDLSISLGSENNKAYITVRGTQENYTAEEFKWAWGIADLSGNFADGKATPTDEDFVSASFDANNQFSVKYCLTDIEALVPGTLYNIYGGTKESYNLIPFASNMFGASDPTRTYYLRQDQDNALVFDSIQPLVYTEASIVEILEADLPSGVTTAGAYLKFGGENTSGLTMETINGWHEAGHIAGDFQRVIGDGYQLHVHEDTERFWKIEGDNVFFYLYVGFIAPGEGWMLHFDLVTGNQNAGLHFDGTDPNGEPPYVIGGETYRVYGNRNKSGEENYWGCLGVYKDPVE